MPMAMLPCRYRRRDRVSTKRPGGVTPQKGAQAFQPADPRCFSPEQLPTLALAGQLVSRAPDITRLLDRLFERGLIDRERPADDRRTVRIGITERGLALLAELADGVRRCHTLQLGHLDPDELRTLVDLLRRARRPHEPPGSGWR